MKILRIKNKIVQQKILSKWINLTCSHEGCLNNATIIMRNNEAVLCNKHYKEYKKLEIELCS